MITFEIRAWDKKEKKIYEHGNPYITQFLALDIANKFSAPTYSVMKEEHNYIFMLSTGLKDKNLKEIYEGDIVRIKIILYVNIYIKI